MTNHIEIIQQAVIGGQHNEIEALIEKALENEGLRDSLKIMVGGAPVDTAFAEKIGADGYGKDAAEAVQLAKSLMP